MEILVRIKYEEVNVQPVHSFTIIVSVILSIYADDSIYLANIGWSAIF